MRPAGAFATIEPFRDNAAECFEEPGGLRVELDLVTPADVTVSFTVINDFTPTTTTTTAPPIVAPAEGAATPVPAVVTFTG